MGGLLWTFDQGSEITSKHSILESGSDLNVPGHI
jgi:hypothetical protein